jgi:hypothetical protein
LNDAVPAAPLPVDPLLSYARRDGDAIRVVLTLPTARFRRRRVLLRLQGKDGGVRARGTVTEHGDGRRVEVTIPRSELPDGVWRLKIRVAPNAPLRNLRTRLLVSDTQPVALLPKFEGHAIGA